MATREELKTIPYTLYTPDDLRLALNETGSPTGIPIPNKVELEDAFGGVVIAGKNTVNYGQGRNQNFINIMANFASIDVAGGPDPLLVPNPLVGQSWYDLDTSQLKIFDGVAWVNSLSSFPAEDVVLDPAVAGETDVQAALEALEILIATNTSDLADHLVDAVDAHDASAISVSPVVLTESDVQSALEALETVASGAEADLAAHLADLFDAHDASAISFNGPFGSISSLNIQGAIEELEVEVNGVESGVSANSALITGHTTDAIDAHDASAISYDNGTSGLTADEVQAAIDELVAGALGTTTVFISANFSAATRAINTVNLPAAFGLGGNPGPDLVQLELVCVTDELGYVTGDIVVLNEQGNQFDEAAGPAQEGSYITWNPSSPLVVEFLVNYTKSNTRILIAQKGSTAQSNFLNITTANWNLRLKAIKFG